MYTKFYSENLKGRDHLGAAKVDRRIILKWMLKEYSVRVWIGLS
jgi:hypothetical protein